MRSVGALGAVAFCLLILAAPADATPRDRSSSLTISVLSSTITDRLVRDVAPKKRSSPGDVYWSSASLTNHVPQFGQRSGALVGIEYTTWTLLRGHRALVRSTAVLPRGEIHSKGGVLDRKTFQTIAIIGGSGRYAGARGSVTAEEVGQLVAVETFRVRLP